MRRQLLLLFSLGVLLLICAPFLRGSKGVRTAVVLLGGTAVIAAGMIDWISKMRQARRRPYTTTDWLKGKPRPETPSRGLRRLQSLLWMAAVGGWAATMVLSDRANAPERDIARGFLLTVYVVMIGIELLRKPSATVDARNSL